MNVKEIILQHCKKLGANCLRDGGVSGSCNTGCMCDIDTEEFLNCVPFDCIPTWIIVDNCGNEHFHDAVTKEEVQAKGEKQ